MKPSHPFRTGILQKTKQACRPVGRAISPKAPILPAGSSRDDGRSAQRADPTLSPRLCVSAVTLLVLTYLLSPFSLLLVCAQQLAIDWYTIDGGGGRSSGGAYTVRATIGQPDASITSMAGGQFTITGGFWPQVAYELMTPELLLNDLITLVDESDLRQQQPLLASLRVALASLERGNHNSAAGQLSAFQNKVRAQVKNLELAGNLINSANRVISALDGNGSSGAVKILSLKRRPNGRMQLTLSEPAAKTYTIQASTNLVDWELVCEATVKEDGSLEFEDAVTAKHRYRFYRVSEVGD